MFRFTVAVLCVLTCRFVCLQCLRGRFTIRLRGEFTALLLTPRVSSDRIETLLIRCLCNTVCRASSSLSFDSELEYLWIFKNKISQFRYHPPPPHFYLFIKQFHKNMAPDNTWAGPTRMAKHLSVYLSSSFYSSVECCKLQLRLTMNIFIISDIILTQYFKPLLYIRSWIRNQVSVVFWPPYS